MSDKEVEIPLNDLDAHTSNGTEPDVKVKVKCSSKSLYLAAVIGDLMTLTAGIGFGWTSPVLPKLDGSVDPLDNPLSSVITSKERAWLGGLVCLGAIFGPLAFGPLADKIGRKKTLLVISFPIFLSFLTLAFASNTSVMYVARLVKGIGIGGIFTVLPMYMGEIAQDHNRGALGCLMTVFTATGFLFTYSVGPFLTVKNFCLVCTIPLTIFMLAFSLWSPESPYYLASIDDQTGLEICLAKLRNQNSKDTYHEVLLINKSVQDTKKNPGGYKDLFRSRNLRRALLVSTGLISLQQYAGINAVLSYMQDIFAASGSGLPSEICAIIIGSVQVVAMIGASMMVDRLGRRILLLTSAIGVGISLISLGVYFHLKEHNHNVEGISWLPVSSLVVFMIAFSLGLQPLPWAMLAELFPSSVKSAASTITSITCFTTAFITTFFFPSVVAAMGMAPSLWSFAVSCFFGTIFVFLLVPETKGKSLQEIQMMFQRQ